MTERHSSVAPSSRGRAGNDPIFALNAEARQRAQAGESILNATLGALMDDDGLLCTMPTVQDTFRRLLSDRTAGYAPISGLPTFRDAVVGDVLGASSLRERAVSVATPGGTGAIYLAVMNFLEPGQRLLVPNFFWGPYREITNHAGRGIDTFSMFEDGRFAQAALADALDRHLREQGRVLLVLNFPCHNPTGYSPNAAEWAEIAAVIRGAAERGPVTVLIDAAYRDFGGAARADWLAEGAALTEAATVLVAWTASKSFAQYGGRIGALVALHADERERSEIANALGYSCRATWSNCNHLGQAAVAELLTDAELAHRFVAEREGLVQLLEDRTAAFTRAAEGSDVRLPTGYRGFFVSAFVADSERAAAAMRDEGVYVTPIPGAVRVALCSTAAHAMPRLVSALEVGTEAGR